MIDLNKLSQDEQKAVMAVVRAYMMDCNKHEHLPASDAAHALRINEASGELSKAVYETHHGVSNIYTETHEAAQVAACAIRMIVHLNK